MLALFLSSLLHVLFQGASLRFLSLQIRSYIFSHFQNRGCLPFFLCLHSSFFFVVVFHLFIFWVCLPFFIFFGACLPFIFWGRFSSWVKKRLHPESQLPMLPGSALQVSVVWVGGWSGAVGQPITLSNPTWVEVELGCDNFPSRRLGSMIPVCAL